MEEILEQAISSEEMIQLFSRLRDGDYSVRNRLIEVNLRLVPYFVYKKFKAVDYDKDDLISMGMIGLINAVDSYDLAKGIKFASYADKCISNVIVSFLRKIKYDSELLSLDSDTIKDESLILMGTIKSTENIEEEVMDKDLQEYEEEFVRNLMDELNPRDREIIKLYFGFYDNRCFKQMEIANIIGIPQSYVSARIKYVTEFMLHQFQNVDSSMYSLVSSKSKKRKK